MLRRRWLTADATGGQFDTPPLRFTGDRLVLNTTARLSGRVRVGLLDAKGKPIPGRSVNECQALKGDDVNWTVTWEDDHHVAKWSREPIRMRIELRDADVFGFQFLDK